ncbi:Hypothetical predicted protein [Mytilus galloprovincialis]|nr:Hypothetical predicted protein [Mytilus galloprovincialis]
MCGHILWYILTIVLMINTIAAVHRKPSHSHSHSHAVGKNKHPMKVSNTPIDFGLTIKIGYPDYVKIGDTYHPIKLSFTGLKQKTE